MIIIILQSLTKQHIFLNTQQMKKKTFSISADQISFHLTYFETRYKLLVCHTHVWLFFLSYKNTMEKYVLFIRIKIEESPKNYQSWIFGSISTLCKVELKFIRERICIILEYFLSLYIKLQL